MKQIVQIENEDKFVRDETTHAVLNTDVEALQMYRTQKRKYRELDKLKDDVCCLKDDISELKQMLVEVLKDKR